MNFIALFQDIRVLTITTLELGRLLNSEHTSAKLLQRSVNKLVRELNTLDLKQVEQVLEQVEGSNDPMSNRAAMALVLIAREVREYRKNNTITGDVEDVPMVSEYL